MVGKKSNELVANPDGATFVSSGLQSFGRPDDAFEAAHTFENLAHSRTLRNPTAALKRAHQLLDIAVELEVKGS